MASNKKIPPQIRKLWAEAKKAQKKAYAPYSKFKVGAAFQSGKNIVAGCNVENASFGMTTCAEQVAINNGVSQGKRKFSCLVLVTSAAIGPCGRCLQVISEFCSPNMDIWITTPSKIHDCKKLKELFPGSITKRHLKARRK